MREIKYRGLSKNGWVYGLPYYSHGTGEWKIARSNGWQPSYSNPDEGESTEWINVDADTIGQFTGLKDKSGKEIYEGDIVRINSYSNSNYMPFGDNTDGYEYEIIGEVRFMPSKGFCLKYIKYHDTDNDVPIPFKNKYGYITQSSATKLGNIYQNPELVK